MQRSGVNCEAAGQQRSVEVIMEYQMCSHCVMDTSDPEIVFDEQGVCNHCKGAGKKLREVEEKRKNFDVAAFGAEVKNSGKGKKYDCIVGISGGVDSCYVMYKVKEMGLRPLAVHIDNGWDSELAVQNIKRLLEKLDIDLYTYVVDWQEFRSLQLAFFRASTPDCEIPTDHMIFPVLGMMAHKYKCRYIITGHNNASESILPRSWSQGHFDWHYIRAVYRMYGDDAGKLKTFPHFDRPDYDYFMRKFVWFNLLDYIDYNKEEKKKFLQENYGWRDYSGKHYESFYTRFYQTYIMPVKFGYDKRRMHLSSLIVAGQLSREEALETLGELPYDESTIERDIEYFLEKMQISRDEFDRIMKEKPRCYQDYPNNENDFTGRVIRKLSKMFGGESA